MCRESFFYFYFFLEKCLHSSRVKNKISVWKQWKWILPCEGTAREVWSDSSHIKTFSRMRLVASECCSVQPCSPFSPPHPCYLSGSAGERRIGPLGGGCLSVRVTLFFSYGKQGADFLGIIPVYSTFGICHGSLPHWSCSQLNLILKKDKVL